MSDAPNNKKCSEFADYLTLTYITQEFLFPPQLWAEKPSDMKSTNSGPESFHCHYSEVYASHPSIFQLLEVLIGQQTLETYPNLLLCHFREGENRISKWHTRSTPLENMHGNILFDPLVFVTGPICINKFVNSLISSDIWLVLFYTYADLVHFTSAFKHYPVQSPTSTSSL